MGLTPVELEGREFSKVRKGYNIEEVDKFFKAMAEEFEDLYRENRELKDTCKRIKEDLGRYKSLENTITETLVTAQKAGEDARNNAVKEAENIIKEAQLKAEDINAKVKADIVQQESELREVIKRHQIALTEMKLFLTTHLDMLDKNGPSLAISQEEEPQEERLEETEIEEFVQENPVVYQEV